MLLAPVVTANVPERILPICGKYLNKFVLGLNVLKFGPTVFVAKTLLLAAETALVPISFCSHK